MSKQLAVSKQLFLHHGEIGVIGMEIGGDGDWYGGGDGDPAEAEMEVETEVEVEEEMEVEVEMDMEMKMKMIWTLLLGRLSSPGLAEKNGPAAETDGERKGGGKPCLL